MAHVLFACLGGDINSSHSVTWLAWMELGYFFSAKTIVNYFNRCDYLLKAVLQLSDFFSAKMTFEMAVNK